MSEFNKVFTSLIMRGVPSKVIRRKKNDKAWFNEDCVIAFYNKQNAYHLWSQTKLHFLWEEYVVHRCHDAQSVYYASLLEYNNRIRESLSMGMHPH